MKLWYLTECDARSYAATKIVIFRWFTAVHEALSPWACLLSLQMIRFCGIISPESAFGGSGYGRRCDARV
jgi:hypothetical protein